MKRGRIDASRDRCDTSTTSQAYPSESKDDKHHPSEPGVKPSKRSALRATDEWRLPAPLPLDITMRVVSRLPCWSDRANLSQTSRNFYLAVHQVWKLHRLPGLIKDLEETRQYRKKCTYELLKEFDDDIREGGRYDEVLLTPLSGGSRLAISLCMMAWADMYTLRHESEISGEMASKRFKEELESFKQTHSAIELEVVLRSAVRGLTRKSRKSDAMPTLQFGPDKVPSWFNSRTMDAVGQSVLLDEMTIHGVDQRDTLKMASDRAKNLSACSLLTIFLHSPVDYSKIHASLKQISVTERSERISRLLEEAVGRVRGTPEKGCTPLPYWLREMDLLSVGIMRMCLTVFACLDDLPAGDDVGLIRNAAALFEAAAEIRCKRFRPEREGLWATNDDFRPGEFRMGYTLIDRQDRLNFEIVHFVTEERAEGYAYRFLEDRIKRLARLDPTIQEQCDTWLKQIRTPVSDLLDKL